jgi:hypothetical protein
MTGYVYTNHPVTGEPIKVIATGKIENDTAEFICLTPRSNLNKLWLRRGDIYGEEQF